SVGCVAGEPPWGLALSPDVAADIAVSPDGATVFVTGYGCGNGGRDVVTVAYNATTGAETWVSRYDGPANGSDSGQALGVSPDGEAVYVIGGSTGSGTGLDFVTLKLDAADGSVQWLARYDGPATGLDGGADVVVSADGTAVFVTGLSEGLGSGPDYATLLYDGATGVQAWVARYDGVGGADRPLRIALAANGTLVVVAGTSDGGITSLDYATAAYYVANGTQAWATRYDGPASSLDFGLGLAVAGEAVFVTGADVGMGTNWDYATVAYGAETGPMLWISRMNTEGTSIDMALDIFALPGADDIFVTGRAKETLTTISYDRSTGDEQWRRTYGTGSASTVRASVKDGIVFAVGYAEGLDTRATVGSPQRDIITSAYDMGTGEERGIVRYNGPTSDHDRGISASPSPTTGGVFVAGITKIQGVTVASDTGWDYVTLAYDLS
ncbi:MAG: hypothetical protein ACT4PT_09440, partial [Methanobacteriota archaeon]